MVNAVDSAGLTTTQATEAPQPPIDTPEAAIEQATRDNGLFGEGHAETQANLDDSREQAVGLAQQQGRYGDIREIERSYAQARVVLDVRDALWGQQEGEAAANLGKLAQAMTLLADGVETLGPQAGLEVMKLVGDELADVKNGNADFSSDANVTILDQTARLAMFAREAGDHATFHALVQDASSSEGLLRVTPNDEAGSSFGDLDTDLAFEALPFYLAVARKTGDADDAALVNKIASSYTSERVEPAVEALVEHSQELQFLIANAGSNASPEALAAAVDDYIAGKGAEWQEKYAELEADVAQQGRALLTALNQVTGEAVPGQRAELVESLVQSPDAMFAIRTALAQDPALAATPGAVETRNALVDGASYGTAGVVTATLLGTSFLQYKVSQALAAGVDPADPRALVRQLESLRDDGLARSLGLSPATLDTAIDKLVQLNAEIDAGRIVEPAQLQAFLDKEIRGDIRGNAAFDPATPTGRLFGGLAGILAAVTLVADTGSLVTDPNVVQFLTVSTGVFASGQQSAQLVTALPGVNSAGAFGQFAQNADFAKLLGGVSVGLSTIAAADAYSDGNWAQGSLQTASALGGAVSLISAGSRLGLWGAAIGTVAAIGSFGLSVKEQRDEANKYENDAAQAFLKELGYDSRAAEILRNNAGNGASPVPVLLRWAAEEGLTGDQAVAFFNNLVARDGGDTRLEEIRDRIHDALEDNDGDPSTVESSSEFDQGDRLDFGSYATVWKGEHATG